MSYCISAVVASLTCWLGMSLFLLRDRLRLDSVVALLPIVLIGTVLITLGALPPFLASRWLARRLCIHSAVYDAASGGITGVTLGPLIFALPPGLAATGVPDLPFWDSYLTSLARTGPFFLIAGAVGGLVYWVLSTRRRV